MNNIFKITILTLLIGLSNQAFAKVYTTKSNGNFTAASVWLPSKPTINQNFTDTIIINHEINLNNSIEFYGVMIINIDGKLQNDSRDINLKNNGVIINYGTVSIRNFDLASQSSLFNNGFLNVNSTLFNEGNLTNNGNLVVAENFINYSSINNTGTLTVEGNFDNSGMILNANTINVLNDMINTQDIDNYGVINVVNDIENSGFILNEGELIVDGNAIIIGGMIEGDGNLCHSDGITDPTGGSKEVTCRICVGESSVLPVTLVDFSAVIFDGKVKVLWTTAAEINNDYFEILKSNDGVQFVSIGVVKGAGNTNYLISYDFIDNTTSSNGAYYQLRQVDFDGKTSVSQVVYVPFSSLNQVSVYPNPIEAGSELAIESVDKGPISVSIFNISGQLVDRQSAESNKILLSVDNLPAGIYILRIFQNNSAITQKLQIN